MTSSGGLLPVHSSKLRAPWATSTSRPSTVPPRAAQRQEAAWMRSGRRSRQHRSTYRLDRTSIRVGERQSSVAERCTPWVHQPDGGAVDEQIGGSGLRRHERRARARAARRAPACGSRPPRRSRRPRAAPTPPRARCRRRRAPARDAPASVSEPSAAIKPGASVFSAAIVPSAANVSVLAAPISRAAAGTLSASASAACL